MNKLNNPSSILEIILSTNELIDKTLQKQDNITSSTNIDTLVEGIYYISSTPSNLPNGLKYLIQLGSTIQIALDQTTGIVYHRAKVGDAFSNWYSCADYEDIPSVGNGTITITQGGATKGTFTTNQSGNLTIDLDAGSVSGTLTNIATGSNSMVVSGATTTDATGVTALGKDASIASGSNGTNGVAIGYNAKCGDSNNSGSAGVAVGKGAGVYSTNGTAVGSASMTGGAYATAIGSGADAEGNYSIQIGKGTNTESNSMYVSVGLSDGKNYKMIDTNGKIPDDRLNTTIARTSQIPTVPTKTSDLTNDSGYITGITSSDVTTALGYTPYDSSNPSGYTTNTGTVTSVNNVSPVNGNVTLSIPAAQVNSDWNATSGKAQILNKPSLSTVATSGSYNDLSNKPTIPTVNNATLTIQKNGTTVKTFTANASSNVTCNITVPTKTSDLTNDSGYLTEIDSSDVTTALGYTPYNSSNPNGYTSNVGTVTKVNNTSPDSSGNVSITIPTVPTNVSSFTNDSKYISNTATGTGALTINGTASNGSYAVNIGTETASTANYGTAIGYKSKATASSSTAIGRVATAGGAYSIAIGYGATISNAGGKSIQLGYGTNSTPTSLNIGFQDVGNYQLLDGTTGLIPDARLSSNIARTSQIPTIPTNISAFTNDSGYITGINSTDVTTALGYTPESNSNLVTSISSSSTDSQYPSAKCVYDELTDKADTDLSNVPTSKGILTESYVNGTSGYRVYADNYCVQWGRFLGKTGTINLLKSYADTNYCVAYSSDARIGWYCSPSTVKTMNVGSDSNNNHTCFWITTGFLGGQ